MVQFQALKVCRLLTAEGQTKGKQSVKDPVPIAPPQSTVVNALSRASILEIKCCAVKRHAVISPMITPIRGNPAEGRTTQSTRRSVRFQQRSSVIDGKAPLKPRVRQPALKGGQ